MVPGITGAAVVLQVRLVLVFMCVVGGGGDVRAPAHILGVQTHCAAVPGLESRQLRRNQAQLRCMLPRDVPVLVAYLAVHVLGLAGHIRGRSATAGESGRSLWRAGVQVSPMANSSPGNISLSSR